MGRLFSWQACPGCQLALQAEQNSRAQTAHWTSWGSAGESASFSWHTAWQVEEGHHVRHGSSSTSDGAKWVPASRTAALLKGSLTKTPKKSLVTLVLVEAWGQVGMDLCFRWFFFFFGCCCFKSISTSQHVKSEQVARLHATRGENRHSKKGITLQTGEKLPTHRYFM